MDTTGATTQHEKATNIIAWGPWLLWILTGTAVGSTSGHFHLLYIQKGIIFGGGIGGLIVGFMPYLARQWRISRVGWWVWTIINLTLTVTSISIVIIDNFDLRHFIGFLLGVISYGLVLTLGIITGLAVARVTRWVCRRWLTSSASWWVWIVGGMLDMAIISTGLYLVGIWFT